METHCWIAHAVPGRVRLRLPASGPSPEQLQETLRAAPGVAGVEYRPASASLLVHYEARNWSPEELGAVAAAAGLALTPRPTPPERTREQARRETETRVLPSAGTQRMRAVLMSADHGVQAFTRGALDLRLLLALLFIGMGVRRGLAMEAVSPTPWFALFWTGAALLLQWLLPEDRPEPASAPARAPADA
jgi:hypothetical protein